MTTFADFSEIMERDCYASWRSVIGRQNEYLIDSVDSTVFTMQETDDRWIYSFSIRSNGKWHQGKAETVPITYDVLASNEHGENRSPENVASDLAFSILERIAGEM